MARLTFADPEPYINEVNYAELFQNSRLLKAHYWYPASGSSAAIEVCVAVEFYPETEQIFRNIVGSHDQITITDHRNGFVTFHLDLPGDYVEKRVGKLVKEFHAREAYREDEEW